MSRYHHITLTVFGILALGFIVVSAKAYAYAMPGTTATQEPVYATSSFYFGGWNNNSWQDLSGPFKNFEQSLQSVNGTNFTIAIPTNTVPNFSDTTTQAVHNAFLQFDDWLAGIIGFHISQFFVILLQLMSWALSITKGFIDWLLSLIR